MSRVALVLAALTLAACERQAADEPVNVASADTGVASVSPIAAKVERGTAMPTDLLGAWAIDCARPQTRITIAPGRLALADGVAIVRTVQRTGATTAIDVDVERRGMRERHSWDLDLSDDGRTLTRVEAPVPDIVYTRCA